MRPKISIRRIPFTRSPIIHSLVSIDASSFGEADAWSHQNFLLNLPGKNILSFSISRNHKTIGFIIGSLYTSSGEIIAQLNRISIAKEAQGEGLGNLLLKKFENSVNKLSISSITLECENIVKLKEFYIHNGYEILAIKEVEAYLISKNKIHRMSKFESGKFLIMKKNFLASVH